MERFGLALKLVAASADWHQHDPDFAESAVQACKDAYAADAWRVVNLTLAQAFVPRKTPARPGSRASPGFMVDALEVAATVKDGLPVLASVLGAWLQARPGRAVRLRVGGVEAEALSTREIERLLGRARALRADAATS